MAIYTVLQRAKLNDMTVTPQDYNATRNNALTLKPVSNDTMLEDKG